MKFTAYLKDGSTKTIEGMFSEWQAFFCANVDHPGEVVGVKEEEKDDLPEFLKQQGF